MIPECPPLELSLRHQAIIDAAQTYLTETPQVVGVAVVGSSLLAAEPEDVDYKVFAGPGFMEAPEEIDARLRLHHYRATTRLGPLLPDPDTHEVIKGVHEHEGVLAWLYSQEYPRQFGALVIQRSVVVYYFGLSQ